MTLNPQLNPRAAEASPSRGRRRGLPGTRIFCRFLPVLLAVLTLIGSPRARAQSIPLVINSPTAIAGSYTPTATVSWAPIDPISSLTAELAYVGRGCPGDVYLANPAGKIALMDRGLCGVSAKVDRAARAGAIAVLLVMDNNSPISFGRGDGSLFVPTLIITKTHGDLIKANLAAPVSVSMGLAQGTPGVQTLAASDLTLTSALVSGRANANGVETAVHFEYGREASLGSSSISQNIGSAPGAIAVSAPLSGLEPDTLYYYRLVANGGGKTVNGSIRGFRTASLPTIRFAPWDTAVMAGENASFSVAVYGTGPFSYQWERVGSTIVPLGAGWSYNNSSSDLSLSNVQESDAGEYRVGVTNPFSAGVPVYSRLARLTVYPAVPPTVSAVTVGEIGTAGAELRGEVNPNGGKVSAYFEFGTTTAYGSKTPEVQIDDNSFDTMPVTVLAGMTRDAYDASFSDNYNTSSWNGGLVTALKPSTTYHCRLVAVSVGGTAVGNDTVFTTAASSTHTVTNGESSGPGSLPDTIAQADLSDTIVFDPALHGQTLNLGRPLILQKWLNIVGPGADKLAITGNDSYRVISVSAGLGTVKISGLTIRDGLVGDTGGGAGIYNSGDLEVNHSVFSDNLAPFSRFSRGGAIWHEGSRLVIKNSQFTGNFAEGGGGAINNDIRVSWYGPEDRTPVDTIISDCVFTGNSVSSSFADYYFEQITSIAAAGGAIQTTRGSLIRNCVFTENDSIIGYQGGGAIYAAIPLNDYYGLEPIEPRKTTIVNCTFRKNHCGISGGAIHVSEGHHMRVEGSTFADNTSDWVAGSIVNQGFLSVKNSTFSGNRSDDTGAISSWSGSVTMLGCTLSGNQSNTGGSITNGDSEFSMGNTLLDGQLSGSFVSLGHNIIGVGDGSMGWTAADLVGSSADPVVPFIGPLADNGGPTWTHALLPGSPAMNSGNNTVVDSTDDQRGAGFPRLYGKAVDVGAYEVSDPFTVHSDVLFDLIQLRNGTTDPAVAKTLAAAITKLSAAIAPSLWQDTYRLDPAAGHAVFTLDLATVGILTGAGWGTTDPALLLCMADRIARAARELAASGINDGALGGSPMATALAMLAKGDAALARGNPAAAAIAHYQSAWKQSLKTRK